MDRRPLDPPPVIKLKLSRSALDPLTGLVYEREMTCTELEYVTSWACGTLMLHVETYILTSHSSQ